MEIAIGTRFFEKADPKRVSVVETFVGRARTCAPHVLVAVHAEEDRSDAIARVNALNMDGVTAFPVVPWGKFVAPLNALISKACERGATHLLLASAEVNVTPKITDALAAEMTGATLVVGAAVVGHELREGVHVGTGVTVPWNTLALWNLDLLQRLGFPLIGDALFDPSQAGVEELCTLSVFQQIYPSSSKAVLLEIPEVEWDTASWDADRLAAHRRKMASKISRPEAQRVSARLPSPMVLHIKHA